VANRLALCTLTPQEWTAERSVQLGLAVSGMLKGYTTTAATIITAMLKSVTRFTIQVWRGGGWLCTVVEGRSDTGWSARGSRRQTVTWCRDWCSGGSVQRRSRCSRPGRRRAPAADDGRLALTPALALTLTPPPPHPSTPLPFKPSSPAPPNRQVFVALILGFFTLWDLPLISRGVESLKQVCAAQQHRAGLGVCVHVRA
jgi:hypothetical protein